MFELLTSIGTHAVLISSHEATVADPEILEWG